MWNTTEICNLSMSQCQYSELVVPPTPRSSYTCCPRSLYSRRRPGIPSSWRHFTKCRFSFAIRTIFNNNVMQTTFGPTFNPPSWQTSDVTVIHPLSWKWTVGLFLWRFWRHTAKVKIWLHTFLTSALDKPACSASSLDLFTAKEEASVIHWMGWCVEGSTAGVDILEKRKIRVSSPGRRSNHASLFIQPVAYLPGCW